MYYVVALGNPGEEYLNTRHNVGCIILDKLLKDYSFPEPVYSAKYQSRFCQGEIKTESTTALYPETFMNNSGVAVKKIIQDSDLSHLVVLHDDTALPLGEIKVSVARGDGGHNGIRSLIKELASNDFIRVRIGIGQRSFFTGQIKRQSGDKLPRFVLGKFTKKELTTLEEVSDLAVKAVETIITDGVESAMNKYN